MDFLIPWVLWSAACFFAAHVLADMDRYAMTAAKEPIDDVEAKLMRERKGE